MKQPFRPLILSGVLAVAALGPSPYVETFDNLSAGLPAGFGVYTAATASALGTAGVFTPTPPAGWKDTGGGFKNLASATGLAATASVADQAAATNRALAVRQVSATDAGAAFVFQATNTTGKTDFALSFKLQSLDDSSPRVATWQVSYGLGAAPTAFTALTPTATTGGSTFSNNPITVSFGAALDNQSGPVTIRIVTLGGTTGGGNRPTTALDDFSLSWNTPTATTPTLTATPAALSFGNQNITTTSALQTYSLSGTNLTGDVTLTTAAPFSISKDGSAFGLTLTYSAAELAAAKPVSVRFQPTVAGPATGSISHVSAGATTRAVALSGAGVDPNQTTFTFGACTGATAISDGWTQFSVAGPQIWACTTFGHDPADATGAASAASGVQINGYDGTAKVNITNEDWLISPAFNLSASTFPLFSFWSRIAFNGAPLRLLVSTNYAGTGDPTAAGVTWTDLNATFPAQGTDRWTPTQNVDLSAYKQAAVYVAFVYNSTTDEGARWTLDDVVLTNSATAPPAAVRVSAPGLSFGYQPVNAPAVQTLTVTSTNLSGDLTLTASDPAFQLSKDGAAYSSTLTYPAATATGTSQAVRVRFLPTTVATNYAATLTAASPTVATVSIPLSGNTYDTANTLEVVNWNMEWFGSGDPSLGPKDKNLQNTNATTVIKSLNADVYALEEVVDTVRLRAIVAGMPGYAYRVSQFGSYADNGNDPDYAGAQKLAFVYRTSVVSNPKFTAFFRSAQADAKPDYSYWASGRFPFVMTADVALGGVSKAVTFVAIHAKANTSPTATSYDRRKNASDELKAKLDADYAGANVVVLGDFNDDLDQTITTGLTSTLTSYSAFTNDAANYPSPTLPLSLAGKKSTVKYNDIIDHVITSKAFYATYLPGTAEIQVGVTAGIASYGTTTSDHYPVLTRYAFSGPLATRASRLAALSLYPNPVAGTVRLAVPEVGNGLALSVYTATGRLVLQSRGSAEQLNQQLGARVGGLAAGLYLVQVVGQQQTYTSRLEKL